MSFTGISTDVVMCHIQMWNISFSQQLFTKPSLLVNNFRKWLKCWRLKLKEWHASQRDNKQNLVMYHEQLVKNGKPLYITHDSQKITVDD